MSEKQLALGPIYNDGTYKYIGEAQPGAALNEPNWRVSRITIATSQIEWADGDDKFNNVFTDLATVAAFSYS